MNWLKSQVQFILGSFYLLISLYLYRPTGGFFNFSQRQQATIYISFTYQEGLEKTWSTKLRNFKDVCMVGARTCSLGPQTTSLYNFLTLRAIVSLRQINWQLTDSRATWMTLLKAFFLTALTDFHWLTGPSGRKTVLRKLLRIPHRRLKAGIFCVTCLLLAWISSDYFESLLLPQ